MCAYQFLRFPLVLSYAQPGRSHLGVVKGLSNQSVSQSEETRVTLVN
jgi:hypothetical protein